MSKFSEKILEYKGHDVLLKDVNGSSYSGMLQEIGEDYCVLHIAKRTLAYNLAQVVSIERREMGQEKANEEIGS